VSRDQVSALVLLGSVDVFLILTARLAFGEKSRFYDDMLYEKVSLVFNFARFATRSLVGSMVFDAVDEDRGGKMNKEELFEVLHKVICPRAHLPPSLRVYERMRHVQGKHTPCAPSFGLPACKRPRLTNESEVSSPSNRRISAHVRVVVLGVLRRTAFWARVCERGLR